MGLAIIFVCCVVGAVFTGMILGAAVIVKTLGGLDTPPTGHTPTTSADEKLQ